jgi:hypothetical protein
MITSKASIAAVALSLFLLFAAAAQADETDQIGIAPRAALSPEGWAKVTLFYSCAPRTGTTYIDMSIAQTWGPDGEFGTSSFEDLSAPLTCDGRIRAARVVAGADLDPYHFVLGPARVAASFWNDVLGHWHESTGFGPRVTGPVVLR